MTKPDYAALQAFLAVASERSFTRAAAKLGVTQSALSHTIRELEERLGLRLLARTTRSVSPTVAGDRLVASLQPAFSQIDAGITALDALKETPSGLIRISCGEHAARFALWPVLEPFLSHNPQIQIDLSIDNSLIDIVAEKFDAGVRHGEIVAKDMIALAIGPRLRMIVVAAPSYLKSRPPLKKPEDLTSHACINIRLPTLGNIYAWEFERRGRSVNVRVDGPLVANSIDIRLRAAKAGLGVAYLPEDVALPALKDGSLEQVLDEWCPYYEGYHLYYPSRRQHTPAFQALLDDIKTGKA